MEIKRKMMIAGAGASGLTCAIYLARAGCDVEVFTDEEESISCLAEAPIVMNYPGFPDGISGYDLLELFSKQAKMNGVKFNPNGIRNVDSNNNVAYDKNGNSHHYDEFVMATGVKPRDYICEGIGVVPVHTCAVCDGNLYGKAAKLAVIGGGDTAVNSALYLSNLVGEVHVIVRKNRLRATNLVVCNELFKRKNVEFHYNSVVQSITMKEIIDDGFDAYPKQSKKKCFALLDGEGHSVAEEIDAIFSCIGYDVNEIKVSGWRSIWKCGDCIDEHHQISVAVGSGAKTALQIIESIKS